MNILSYLDPSILIAIVAIVIVTSVILIRMTGSTEKRVFLDKTRRKFKLVKKTVLSHDTCLFRFELPKNTPCLGLPIGKHLQFFAPNVKGVKTGEWNGRPDPEVELDEIQRKYTPVSSNDEHGYVEFVIKHYQGGVIDRFPDGGKMSNYIHSLKINDYLDVQGPVGLNEYKGNGVFSIVRKERVYKQLGLIAGGTGITPMLQIIHAILKHPEDKCKMWLLYANQTEDDILVRQELEDFQRKFPERLHIHYTLDRPPKDWAYSTGFIDEAMVREHLPEPSSDTGILMCGPPPMIKFACRPNLEAVGHHKNNLVEF